MYPHRIFLIVSLLTLVFYGHAQEYPDYIYQQDDSTVRASYYYQSMEKRDSWLRAVPKSFEKDYNQIYKAQFKEIGDLWQSSRVVTDPEVHNYLQSIVSKITQNNPQLKNSDARIVFSRDWWPNAYSMGDGSIAINAGLMIFLENESQLAFVISHELAHYHLDHTGKAIRKYVETVNDPAFQAELKRLSKEKYQVNQQLEKLSQQSLFSIRRHKRENEAEADRLAFMFMKNSGYNCNAIRETLALLDRVDDSLAMPAPVIERVFNLPDYAFKPKWVKKESAIFSQLSTDDDKLSAKQKDSLKTHPDCELRIKMLEDSLANTAGPGNTFQVSESTFRKLKSTFFAEMAEQCFRDEQLSRSLYFNLQLLGSKEYYRSAVYGVMRCLNTIYEKQRVHKLGSSIEGESRYYSESYNALLRMLSRIRLEEIAGLCHAFASWNEAIMKDHPGFAKEMNKTKQFKQ